MSVAQADEVIIALSGDKSKMSIYEKNPSGEGFDFNWRLYVLWGICSLFYPLLSVFQVILCEED